MGPDLQLREDLADAMRDCGGVIPVGSRDSGELQTFYTELLCPLIFAVRFLLLLFPLMNTPRENICK
jgi:hypothetical protein